MKQFMFIVALVIVYLLGNAYVFHHLWVAMPPNLIGRIAIISFATVAILSFFIFYAAGETLPIGLSSFFYKIGTAWLFTVIYFFIILFVKDLIGLSNKLFHFMPPDTLTRYTKENWLGLGLMVGFITMLMICGFLKYQWKVKVNLPVTTDKSIGNRQSLRAVAISDMHLGYGIGENELSGWVDMINKEKPDIIFIAGDIIDSSTRPLNAGRFAEIIKQLQAPLGIYACMGNHEYISGAGKSQEFIRKSGIKLLKDSVALVDNTFYVVGRDDRTNPDRLSLSTLTANIDKSKYIVMLDHQPYHLEEAEKCGIDLQLSGHTHQGQVWPISMITKAIYETDHGFLTKGRTNYYVSSGLGIWGGKFRIGTQSEYVVIDIKQI